MTIKEILVISTKNIDKENAKVTPAPPTIMVVETASKASAEANIFKMNIMKDKQILRRANSHSEGKLIEIQIKRRQRVPEK